MNTSAEETRSVVPREILTEDSTALSALGVLVRSAIDELGAYAAVCDFQRGVEHQPITFTLTVSDKSLAPQVTAMLSRYRREHGIDLRPSAEGCVVYFTVPADVVGKHGRHTTYGNNGCRGELCKVAKKQRVQHQKEQRRLRLERENAECDPKRWPHGTVNGYMNHGCRGEHCQAAWASDAQARRHVEAKQREQLAAVGE